MTNTNIIFTELVDWSDEVVLTYIIINPQLLGNKLQLLIFFSHFLQLTEVLSTSRRTEKKIVTLVLQ